MVSLYQFAITIGIVLAYFANAYMLNLSELPWFFIDPEGLWHKLFVDEVWRAMFGSEAIPALLFLSPCSLSLRVHAGWPLKTGT